MLQSIKQAMNRTKQRLQETFGKAQKTVDDEFEQYKEEYNDMEKHYYKLLRAVKRYHDALRTLALANEDLAHELGNFYQPGAPHEKMAKESIDVLGQIQNLCMRAVDSRFQDDILKPLGLIIERIEASKKFLDDRHRAQLEYDYYRNKLMQLVEKGTDQERIQRNQEKMAERKAAYEQMNARATAELGQLADTRYKMFDYSFFTLMLTFEEFYASAARAIKPLRRYEDAMPDKYLIEVPSTDSNSAAAAAAASVSSGAAAPALPRRPSAGAKDVSEDLADSAAGAALGAAGLAGGALGGAARSAAASAIKAKVAGQTADVPALAVTAGSAAAAAVSSAGKRSIAQYDYVAQDESELTLHEGDIVFVTGPAESEGWSHGRNADTGRSGVFPTAYVADAPSDPDPVPEPVRPAPAARSLPTPSAPPTTPPSSTRALPTAPAKSTPPLPSKPVAAVAVDSSPALALPAMGAKAVLTRSPVPVAPAATPAAVVAACGTCGCDSFVAHPFKKGQCSTCFHNH